VNDQGSPISVFLLFFIGIGVGIGIGIEWLFGFDDALRKFFRAIPIAIPTPMTAKDSGFSVVRNADRF